MGDFTSRLHGGQSRTSGSLFCLVAPYSCETGSLTEPMAWLTTPSSGDPPVTVSTALDLQSSMTTLNLVLLRTQALALTQRALLTTESSLQPEKACLIYSS